MKSTILCNFWPSDIASARAATIANNLLGLIIMTDFKDLSFEIGGGTRIRTFFVNDQSPMSK